MTRAESCIGVVLQIWQDLFKKSDLTASDDFFELGGDSLQLMTMLFHIEEALGIEVHPGLLFQCPTLGAFARKVDELGTETGR